MRLAAVIVLLAASASAMSPGSVEYAARWIGEQSVTASDYPVTNGLVCMYLFDETLDSSVGSSQTLTNTAGVPQYATGKFGNSLFIETTNNSRFVTSFAGIETYPYAIAAWVNANADGGWGGFSTGARYVGGIQKIGASTTYFSIGGQQASVTNGKAALFHRATSSRNVTPASPEITTNVWFHVAIVADSAASGVLYLNGVEIGSTAASVGTNLLSQADGSLQVIVSGLTDASTSIQTWRGSIDDFTIWNRGLTSQEVVQVYEYVR